MPCLSFPSSSSVRTQTKSATATSLAILIGIGDAGRSRSRRGGSAGAQIRSIKSSRVDETRQGRIEMASAARSSIARALRRVRSQQLQPQSHGMATSSAPKRKVAVLGAAGGIGQPLGLLMKLNPLVTHLSLYDIVGTPGVAADISHVNTPAEVDGYAGEADLGKALDGADVVIIPAGIPRKPGMTRDDLFKINAGIVKSLVEGVAKFCPEAILAVISNPVNSTVPIAAEVLKLAGTYDPKKLFGVTTLDVVRARTFYAAKKGLNVRDVDVPVIGGHAGITILPLFSQATPRRPIGDDEREALTKRTQEGGTEVVTAKAGKGSATLSMAYAGALFAEAALKGLNGEKRIVECTYVQSSLIPDLPYFSSKVRLGPQGVEEILPLGTLSEYENRKLEELKSELLGSINKGIDFVKQS